MSEDIDQQYVDLRAGLVAHLTGAGRLAVVKAPPGSGKTHTLIEVLSTLVAAGQRVAIAAQTNSQADDICLRFAADHPEVPASRFSSKGSQPPASFPVSVSWLTATAELPTSATAAAAR